MAFRGRQLCDMLGQALLIMWPGEAVEDNDAAEEPNHAVQTAIRAGKNIKWFKGDNPGNH